MQITVTTEEGVYFKNHYKSEPAPFVAYADFEAIIPKVQTAQPFTTTEVLHIHQARGYAYTVVFRDPDYPFHTWYYRGEDAVDPFLQDMMKLEEDLLPYMDLTQEEKDRHRRATVCYICHKPFTQQDWKVRDHDHATQEYQGPAHNTCDIQKRRRTVIPVIFNNLRGFDSHLLLQQLHTVEARK